MDVNRENVQEIGGMDIAREMRDWAVVDRAVEVARRREEAERQKKIALQQKLEEKEKKRGRGALAVLTMHKNALPLDGDGADDCGERGGGRGGASSEVLVLEAEEARLERQMDQISREMEATDVSQAKKFALKKSLAVCRAEWLKIQRKSKAARAEQVMMLF